MACEHPECRSMCWEAKEQRHDELAAERAAGRRDERANVARYLEQIGQPMLARDIKRGEHER